ncbi:MAG TPA: AAA family ATPase [Thermoanaerobaculia bacterium]|nr:AAA family ATPase [Thermoanaerobaculia bacterium]
MRLLELHLKAFGPFTGRRLDLSGGEHGLHLVFGPNEAGKSSALRALKALLFGFPARSPDDFLHSYDQLRVGGRLLLADGSEVSFLRRKGSKNTLLSDAEESPLDGAFLDRCLQGMEEAHFSNLFGIDHGALVGGGRELLAQHGEVGQALFAAGLGSRSLRRVLQSLDEESEGLFLPRGTKPLINQALAEYKETKRELSDASLSGRKFEDLRKERERLRGEAEALAAEIAARGREKNRLERLRRALPLLAERRRLLARLGELEGAAVLPPEFPERRQRVQEALRKAREDGRRAAAEREGLAEEAAGLTVAAPVLAQAETIERLHRDVGRFGKDSTDRVRLQGEVAELRAQAAELLDEVRPGLSLEEAESLLPASYRWMRIQELSNQRQALVNGLDQARRAAAEAASALEAARDALARLPDRRDPGLLRRRAEAARRAGSLDDQRAEAAAALRSEGEQLALGLGRLGLWSGTAEELESLPVPPAETLERFGRDLDVLAERRRTLEERRRAAREALGEAIRQLEMLHRSGSVPAEDDLARARQRRDQGWDLLRRQWLEGEDVAAEARRFDPARPLPDAYEQTVEAADDLADRLRREADRVQLQARYTAERDRWDSEAASLDAEVAALAEEAGRAESAWKELWRPCGLDPLPPREMHPAWTARYEKLRARAEAIRAGRRRLEGIEEAIARHREALMEALAELGETAPGSERLEPTLALAEDIVRRLEGEERQRVRQEEAVREAEGRLAGARRDEEAALAARERWSGEWAETIRDLGLGGDALPSEVSQLVASLQKISEARRNAEKIERRIGGLARDIDTFRDAVRALAAEFAAERLTHPPDQTAVHLHALLQDARRRADRREALEQRMEKLGRELLEAEATRRAMEERLAELRQEAGCAEEADLADLDEAERRSAEVRDLRRDLDRNERQLLEAGEGVALDDLGREAEGVDTDELPGRIEQLEREVEEREGRLGDFREELGRRGRELEELKGGDAAAQAAERAEEVMARLRDGVDRYVRLRLAGILLRRRIERYRAENQAPLLRRAGELFATLTLGSFAGLQTDYDEKDDPVLVGVRAEGQRVRVEGMSDGARDQLYLALRLATLEKHLAHAEPLPFVVDDILINFDDRRSEATLRVLAELSKRTQVILFTHHERLKEMAGALRNGAGVFVREL